MASNELENKRNAMLNALEKTDALMDSFMNVLKQDFDNPVYKSRDFSQTVLKIFPEQEVKAPVKKIEDDQRLHMSFQSLVSDALECKRCTLCESRTNVVFGTGCIKRPILMVIDDRPDDNSDKEGISFIGESGAFLDRWLLALKLSRDKNVYMTNIIKCKSSKDDINEEIKTCLPFLKQQIELIQPQALLCLGEKASSFMTNKENLKMDELHGKFFFYEGLPMMCTYHPSEVLRNLSLKRPVWEDLKKLARYLGLDTIGRT